MRLGSWRTQKSAGFTLLELIMVCCIIGILGTVTVAGFSTWMPNYRLKTAARDLYSNMQQAKMAAIKQEGNCTITYKTLPSHQYAVTGVTKTVILGDYGSGVKFQGPLGQTFDVAVITFNSRGMCAGTAGTEYSAYLSNEKQTGHYKVKVSTAGIVKLEKLD